MPHNILDGAILWVWSNLNVIIKNSMLLDPLYICTPNYIFLCHLEILKTKMHYILIIIIIIINEAYTPRI